MIFITNINFIYDIFIAGVKEGFQKYVQRQLHYTTITLMITHYVYM